MDDFLSTGFFYCCPGSLSECDGHRFHWPVISKASVSADESRQSIDIKLHPNELCPHDKSLPYWLGYAFTKVPFPKDYDAPIYARDAYQLPAALWRCKVVSEQENGRNNRVFRGCEWKKVEKWYVDKGTDEFNNNSTNY